MEILSLHTIPKVNTEKVKKVEKVVKSELLDITKKYTDVRDWKNNKRGTKIDTKV